MKSSVRKFPAPPTLQITDHAVLRWLERVKGIDTTEAIQAILSPELLALHKKLGDGEYPVNGMRVVIRGNQVRTILPLTENEQTRTGT